jgi:hypothetical protein
MAEVVGETTFGKSPSELKIKSERARACNGGGYKREAGVVK